MYISIANMISWFIEFDAYDVCNPMGNKANVGLPQGHRCC